MDTYSDQELNDEIERFTIIEPKAGGFASSHKILHDTYQQKIIAVAFHIPGKDGLIYHFNLSIRIFKRKKKSEPWQEHVEQKIQEFGTYSTIELKVGNAVENLTKFLNEQYEFIGKKIETKKQIVEYQSDISLSDVVKKLKDLDIKDIEEINRGVEIKHLKKYKDFLSNNLDKNETFIQDWLDEENGKYRKQRCLIFGLEYIDHKREGAMESKRFDLLTRASKEKNEYVLIELKSPCDDVFKIKETNNKNGGKSYEYHLSSAISRSIPQILRYKSKFENYAQDSDDLSRIGVEKGTIKKSIIVLGTSKNNDPIWVSHFNDLKATLSNNLEVVTYTDLIDKLDVTILNLESEINHG